METRYFLSDGVKIAYSDEGQGDCVLLIHGFGSNTDVNWRATGWIDSLKNTGKRVIAFDNRGHGKSQKLYDLNDYSAQIMAADAKSLLDHLGIEQANVIGYSMGARIAAFLAINYPERVASVIFAGMGENMVLGTVDPEPVALALEATSLQDVQDKRERMFRQFAESTGSDLKALAACMRSPRPKITPQMLGALTMPVLIVTGERDHISGPPEPLAACIPNAKALVLPRRDHMTSVGDKLFKQEAIKFMG